MRKVVNLDLEEVKADMSRVYEEYGKCTYNTYIKYGKFDPQYFPDKLHRQFSELQAMLGIPTRKYNYSKEEVVEDVLRVYNECDGYLTKDMYIERGKYSRKPINRYFGSWNKMLQELDLPVNCLINIPEDDLLKDLVQIYEEYDCLSAELVKEYGQYSLEVYQRRFGCFNNAVIKAGLEPNEVGKSSIADYLIHTLEYILEEEAQPEKTFSWLKYKKSLHIDAYFHEHNLAFEYNGRQHYEAIPNLYGEDSNDRLEVRQARDQEKYRLLKEHGINLLVIRYDEPKSRVHLMKRLSEIL
jgi:hypothetical protein